MRHDWLRVMSRLMWRDAPHPLRGFFLLFIVSFVIGAAITPFYEGWFLRLVGAVMGIAMMLIGFLLVTNSNGATGYYLSFSRRKTIRIGAVLFILVGVLFTAGAITGPL